MRILTLLVLTAALSGCFGGDGDGGDDDGDPRGGTTTAPPGTSDPPRPGGNGLPPAPDRLAMLLQFSFEGCSGAEALYHPDVATAQAALPEGYTAHGTAAPTGDPQASVQYLWAACATFSTRSTEFNGTVYGHVAVRIEPPGNITADSHWYRLRMLAEGGIMQQLWLAAQYEVYTGALNRTAEAVGPLQARTEGLGEYVLQGAEVAPGGSVSGSAAYYTQTPSGTLEWTGELDATRRPAHGSFSVPEDDPFSQAMAADPVPVADTWFHDDAAFTGNDLWLVRET